MDDLGNENIIKAYLIDYLCSFKDEDEILGSEVMFGSSGRFADIVFISNKLIAFEIKAQNDDLRNIRKQLDAYKKVFDKLYLVVTRNHFIKAKKVITSNEGLIIIDSNDEIEIVKEPKQIKRHNKTEIIETINANFLKEYLNVNGRLSAKDIRKLATKKDALELKKVLFEFYKQKLIPKNLLFFSEKGTATHFEDIALLSFNNETKLF